MTLTRARKNRHTVRGIPKGPLSLANPFGQAAFLESDHTGTAHTKTNPTKRLASERRHVRRFRSCMPCTARQAGTELGMYWTENVSGGGALFESGRIFNPGAAVSLVFCFPWTDPVGIEAVVAHQAKSQGCHHGFGVNFCHHDVDSQFHLWDALDMRSQVTKTNPADARVLIAIQSRHLRHALTSDILMLNGRSALAETPAEVVSQLANAVSSFDLVFLDTRLVAVMGLHWLMFLKKTFPHVRRVLIGEPPIPTEAPALLVDHQIHALLVAPWNLSYLGDILSSSCTNHTELGIASAHKPKRHTNLSGF